MTTQLAEEGGSLNTRVTKLIADTLDRLAAKVLSRELKSDAPPEDLIEPVDLIRAGIGAKLLAQDGVSQDALARLSIFDLRILFDVYQGRFGTGNMVDYIGRVPDSSILLGQG